MFTSLTIKNFRLFSELNVTPLGRVNLISGKNNVGKTALLEAIYLHCHPCDAGMALQVNELRAIENPKGEDVGTWLFLNADKSAEIITQDETIGSETSTVQMVDTQAVQLPEHSDALEMCKQSFGPDWDRTSPWFVARYRDSHGFSKLGIAVPLRLAMGFVRGRVDRILPSLLVGSTGQLLGTATGAVAKADENALFSELDVEGRQEEVLKTLQFLEPRLEQLSLLVFNQKPVIHGQLKSLRRKIPVPLMGEGVRRLLLIALAIANAKGGVVLIDEVENGLHYSSLVHVWKAIADAARRLNVQVFATTHSWECIRSAHEAFSASPPYDLRLHRLDRLNGQIRAVTYDQTSLGTSVDMNLEVR